ncbi:hypothetical protein, variant [Aphanomyces astaci]|uniref:CFA20 domain-containing protein n=1 Tax=Aphanomyces astaci TaxID=112090 RepID=W4G9U2_APHAT|nr:hypothetical protein, variant [Aphanomyces astaci]ETV75829.1 hypothetical protein, variant [Aphanomyces astaci]|eukprot:XP_009834960.1 hypothetical protein, variant [Aphanomyces astaci]
MYQGGDSVELLAAGGKDPAAPWKLTGKVRREYDKPSKVFLFTMEGSALATKMTLPKDSTKSLGLTQRYLVLQVSIPAAAAISVEVGVLDTNGTRRRVVMSSAFRGAVVHQLHAQIPLNQVTRDVWLNWCFDVAALVDASFATTFRTIDSICLSGTCKLRRVFTMKEPPIPSDHPFDFVGGVDIPRTFFISGAVTEYFAAKAVAVPLTKPEGKPRAAPDNATSRDKPKATPRPSSSTKAGGATLGNKPSLAGPRKHPSTSSLSRSKSSRGGKLVAIDDEVAKPVSPLLRPGSSHSKHIQARKQITLPSSSMFRFAFTERPSATETPTVVTRPNTGQRQLESKFQSWEDDDASPVKPSPLHAVLNVAVSNSNTNHVNTNDELPNETLSRRIEYTANELAKELSLDESPFFREAGSPAEASKGSLGGKPSWWDDDNNDDRPQISSDVDQPSTNSQPQDNQHDSNAVSIGAPALVNQSSSEESGLTNSSHPPSLFQWAPQCPLNNPNDPSRTTAAASLECSTIHPPPKGDKHHQKCNMTSDNEEPQIPDRSQNTPIFHQRHVGGDNPPKSVDDRFLNEQNRLDDNDDLDFDMTNDLQADQSFDFTDVLEESLPSMVQIHSPVKRPPVSQVHHAPALVPTARSIVVDPRIQSLLESTGMYTYKCWSKSAK